MCSELLRVMFPIYTVWCTLQHHHLPRQQLTHNSRACSLVGEQCCSCSLLPVSQPVLIVFRKVVLACDRCMMSQNCAGPLVASRLSASSGRQLEQLR